MQNEINLSSRDHLVRDPKIKESKLSTSDLASDRVQNPDEFNSSESAVELVKKQFNRTILESHLEVSMSVGNEPMSLLFKAAIDGINSVLEGDLGENAIKNAYDSDVDVSPEATADRIVSMSTAFFPQYRSQNADTSDSEAAQHFATIIEGGIDTGFLEARNVLEGLNVLEGDIANNIDTTYQLVQQGLKGFIDSFNKGEKSEQSKL